MNVEVFLDLSRRKQHLLMLPELVEFQEAVDDLANTALTQLLTSGKEKENSQNGEKYLVCHLEINDSPVTTFIR